MEQRIFVYEGKGCFWVARLSKTVHFSKCTPNDQADLDRHHSLQAPSIFKTKQHDQKEILRSSRRLMEATKPPMPTDVGQGKDVSPPLTQQHVPQTHCATREPTFENSDPALYKSNNDTRLFSFLIPGSSDPMSITRHTVDGGTKIVRHIHFADNTPRARATRKIRPIKKSSTNKQQYRAKGTNRQRERENQNKRRMENRANETNRARQH